jgi:hypothetical protein
MRDLGAVLDHEEPLPHPAQDQAQWLTKTRPRFPQGRSHTACGLHPTVLPSSYGGYRCQTIDRRASLLLRKHAPRCNIGRGVRHSEEDDDLAAWLALESATMFFHWLLADRAQGCHRVHW